MSVWLVSNKWSVLVVLAEDRSCHSDIFSSFNSPVSQDQDQEKDQDQEQEQDQDQDQYQDQDQAQACWSKAKIFR